MKDTYAETHRQHMHYELEREEEMRKKLRRLWWNWSDDIGIFLWMVVALLIGSMAWLCFDGLERFFR